MHRIARLTLVALTLISLGTEHARAQVARAPLRTWGKRLLWHNVNRGEVANWPFDDAGTVQRDYYFTHPDGTKALCPAVNGCSNDWRLAGTLGSDILWRYQNGSLFSTWIVNQYNVMTGFGYIQSAVCAMPGFELYYTGVGCTSDWDFVGTADVNGDGGIDLVWRKGQGLYAWLLDASHRFITETRITASSPSDQPLGLFRDSSGREHAIFMFVGGYTANPVALMDDLSWTTPMSPTTWVSQNLPRASSIRCETGFGCSQVPIGMMPDSVLGFDVMWTLGDGLFEFDRFVLNGIFQAPVRLTWTCNAACRAA